MADDLREEMEVVAAGLDLLIQGGCDQAANLVKLRDYLRRVARSGDGRDELQRENETLRVVVNGLLDCHPTRDPAYPPCGYVVEARRLLGRTDE